jgi:arabinofuranosyltransferase
MSDEEMSTPGGEAGGKARTTAGTGFEIPRAVLLAIVALYGFVVLRTAWLCDDAYITFRTIDNLFAGQGLTYNVGERVQAFTHPLWLMLLSTAFSLTHEFWNTAVVVSLAVSLATVVLFAFGVARSRSAALVGVLALTLSKAYVDYSTSGLENPLSNLLLAAFLFVYFRAQQGSSRLLLLSLIASLATVTRPDALLLFIPALLWELWENRSWKALRVALLGFLPLFLWEAFSLFYYGFLFPNTAYAKLNTGLSLRELAGQGWRYVGSSIHADPITPLVILAGVGAALVAKSRRSLLISIGLILYLAYVVSIGGDFMRGRFFTMPLLWSHCWRWSD